MSNNNMGQPVVVNSDIIIKEIQEGRSLKPIAKRIKKHKSKMVIPESVLGEVHKITGNETDVIMDTIYQYCKQPITVDKSDRINSEAERLVEQYDDCRSSDSLILATAKITGSALVCFDKEMLETAKLEGINAFLPRNFVRWW